jgi:hypothetical protein
MIVEQFDLEQRGIGKGLKGSCSLAVLFSRKETASFLLGNPMEDVHF